MKKIKSWCHGCMDNTIQKVLSEGPVGTSSAGNRTLECLVCGSKNYQIQGFNSNLM